MEEQPVFQPMPTTPAPQVVPPAAPTKKPGVLWFITILAIVLLGGVGYVLYAQLTKPSQEVSVTPSVEQKLGAQPAVTTPVTTPTITSSDSLSDIEKDLSGTTIESQNASKFDADLQSL